MDPGETDEQALARELLEELGCVATVGERVGPDLPLGDTGVLRVYLASLQGEPQLLDHDAHRWLSAAELADVPWIPVDAPVIEAVRPLLARAARR